MSDELDEEITPDEAVKLAEGLEPPATDWALRRPRLTKRERMQWALAVLELRTQGLSYRSIEKRLGMSPATVGKLLHLAYKTYTLPNAEESRKFEIGIIDDMLERLRPLAENDLNAADKLLKYLDRRARLTGSEMPIRVDAQVTEVTAAERELSDLLAQAERDAKVQEKGLKESAQLET